MLPFLNETSENTKKYVVNFRGLNLGEGYQDGDFSNTENVSSVLAPCLTQRYGRTLEATYGVPRALHAKDGLVVIDGTAVKYNGAVVGTVTDGRKQIATVGNYVVIFPDKVYYNVATGEFGSMDIAYSGTATFTDSTIKGASAFGFRAGDAVTISGCSTSPENNKTVIIRGVNGDTLTFYSNTFTAGTEDAVTIKREVPDLDYICESNYRLWGTKGNTIYGSKYSDPFNFQVFDGLTGDSYYIDVGSDGEFTGCIPYSSHICFFKEHTLHKLYGSKPSNFQIVTSQVYGVQAGSERSMRVINETLLYKGVGGVYAYAGGVPELISSCFATTRFSDACAESDGERYYISMRNGSEWSLFVYDVLRNLWLREDDTNCVDMAFCNGYVYLLSADGGLYKVDPAAGKADMAWSATFCPFTETINERKVYSKFHLRMELGAGAWLKVETRLDNSPRWQTVFTTHNERSRTVTVPVMPGRCDSVEIRLSGKGECLLRTFVREFQVGSDV
jgi:hypothetical protein